MPFEKFVPRRKQKPPQASVKRTGTVSFDLAFASSIGLDKAQYVTLYFDAGRKLLGVRPAADGKEEGAVKLSHRKRVSSVRARPLFDSYGITLASTARVPVTVEDDGMVIVPLPAARGKRGPRKKS